MKKLIFSLLICILFSGSYGQNTGKYSALLLNLKGEGTLKRSSQTFDMQMPQSYIPGDNLSLKKGDALIMLFSGEEVHLNGNSSYRIPELTIAQATEIQQLSENIYSDYGLLAQSGAAYSIRGEPLVYPMKSRLLDSQNAILRIYFEKDDSIKPVIKVIDSQTQKTIFEKTFVSDSLIYLNEVPFRDGGNYYWTISGMPDNKPCLGSIIIPGLNERNQLRVLNRLETNLDYITAISYYFDNKYFFEALSLTQQAIDKFPEVEIYKLFLENLKNE